MNDNRLANSVNRLADNVWWVAVWLFCIFLTQCGTEHVYVEYEAPPVVVEQKSFMETMDALDDWREGLSDAE